MADLTRISSPGGAFFTVAQPHADRFQGLINDLEGAGYKINGNQSGGYNYRTIAGTNKLSNHAHGAAIDVNWTDNARGTPGNIPADLARSLAQKHGLTWGGDWKNPDPMHFEVPGQPGHTYGDGHNHGAAPATTGATPMAAPALTPYDGPSPDDVAMQRKLAMSLMQGATSAEPVGHWTQALARVLQGGVGGMYRDQASEGEKQGRSAIASSLSGNASPAALATNPWLGDLGVQMFKQQAAVQPLIIPADAKAIIPDRSNPGQYKDLAVGQPKMTTDENNYKAYVAETTKAGQTPMSFIDYQVKLKQAGATAITNDMRGENAEAKGIGEGAAKRANSTIDSARAASTTLRRLNDLQARLDAVQNGKLEPGKATVGAWAKAFGLKDEQLAGMGIDPKLPGSAQAIQALSNRMVVDMIGSGGFPANNFSDADRAFLEKTVPSLGNEPRANKLILEAGRRMAQLDIEKGQALSQWRRDPANKGKSVDDFELAWSDDISKRDIMGDLRKEADALVKSPDAPLEQRNLPRISAPEQVKKLPKGTKFIDPQGNVRVVP